MARILWGGGHLKCSNNTVAYESVSAESSTFINGSTVLTAACNTTDADVYVDGENGKYYVFKTKCKSSMKCTYNSGKPKLYSNNTNIWYESFENGDFTIANDYTSYSYSGSNNDFRSPNNISVGSNDYVNFTESSGGTAEYYFTQDAFIGNGNGQTNLAMFSGCSDLVTCEVPCEMNKISDYTFADCTSLTSYTVNPDFVSSIGMAAFSGCTSLPTILIPKYSNISSYSFTNCSNATAIKWDGMNSGDTKCNLTIIPDYAFKGCIKLSGTVFDDCSFNDTIVIPNGISGISQYAFYKSSPRHLDLNGVKEIGESAFEQSPKLISISIPNDVTSIGHYAFAYCSNLTSCTIGSGNTNISSQAFAECSALTSITINKGNKTISSNAFDGNSLINLSIDCDTVGDYFKGNRTLKNVVIGDNATSIGTYAFGNCSSLSSCTIGTSVRSIGNNALQNCSGLTNITIPNSVSGIGSSAFYACSGLTNITIPNSVIDIGGHAFQNCRGLTSVTIGSGVKEIGDQAFYLCNGLTSITSLALEPPDLGSGVFYGTNNCTIYVPNNSVSITKYKEKWSNYSTRISGMT